MRARSCLPLLAALLALGLARAAAAQSLAVRVVDDSSRAPLAGALVRLVRHDSTVAQALTGDQGRVTLAVPAGRYTVRVARIGFVVKQTWTVDLAPGETRTLDIGLVGERILLPTVVVQGERRCGAIPDDARATAATLWQAIRDALTATRLSQRSQARYRISTFERELSTSHVTRAEQRSAPRTGSGQPFGTLPPAQLAREGFVQVSGQDRLFYGPDAELLLSDEFVAGHCFQMRPPPDSLPDHVGLGFEPARRRDLADIRGVLWVDRKSAELRVLEFWYVGPPDYVPEVGEARGWVRFDREPGGQWYISDWTIRMPKVARIERRRDFYEPPRDSLLGYVERGGGAEPAERPRAAAVLATVRGAVYDSLGGRGLPGVMVTVAGALDSALTDSAGRFTLAAPVGRRTVTFRHPLLDLTAGRGVVDVTLGAEGASLETGTPSARTLAAVLCEGNAGAAALIGRIRATPGEPREGRAVQASYFTRAGIGALREETISTTSDATGLWAICEAPPVRSVVVRQQEGSRVVAQAVAPIEAGQATWVDFAGPGETARALALRVVGRSGRPVPAAEVTLPDLGWSGLTDQDGRFVVPAAPAKMVRVSVKALGARTLDTTLTRAAGDTAAVELRLTTDAPGAVAAAARDSSRPADKMRAFERRRADGSGRFFDRAAIDALGNEPLVALLRRVPRVRVVEQGGQAAVAASLRGSQNEAWRYEPPWPVACYLQVIVDGVRVWVPGTDPRPYDITQHRLDQLQGIELYTGPDTPGELNAARSWCGTIVLWTR